MTARRWIQYTIAIVLGNAIYFLWLAPALGQNLRHQPMRLDAGLALDFICCLVVYAVIRLGAFHARRQIERRRQRPSA